jgi:hypothetical protein
MKPVSSLIQTDKGGPMSYEVTIRIITDAGSPLEAARLAFGQLLAPETRPRRLEVSRTTYTGPLRETSSLAIELPEHNPLGRPPVILKEDTVCCGHCGSSLVLNYHDEATRHAPLGTRNGLVFLRKEPAGKTGQGSDPRAWCAVCKKESALPDEFAWA